MESALTKSLVLLSLPLVAFAVHSASAATEDLGNGFLHHGVATPVSNHRGTVATVDGEGRDVVLVWLFDHRGGYALLMIDAETGKSEEFPMPFPPGGDCPYASILSSQNKFYTHFNSHFCEFDPEQRAFTFFHKTAPQMAMGMTEDDNGVIWSVTYPNSGVVSFDPNTREFKDYGYVHKENWRQYQRYVAADDTGWIYFGIGSTASQIIAFDPRTGEGKAMIPEEERAKGAGYVYRDMDGKVYGHAVGGDNWYEFYQGKGKKIGKHETIKPKPIITSSQGLFYRNFPDGKQLKACDLVNRVLVVEARAHTSWGWPSRPMARSAAARPSPCASSATTRKRTNGSTARATANGTPWRGRVTASSLAATAAGSCWNGTPRGSGRRRRRAMRPATLSS